MEIENTLAPALSYNINLKWCHFKHFLMDELQNKKAECQTGEHCNGNNSQWPQAWTSSVIPPSRVRKRGWVPRSDQEKLVLAQNEKES